MHDSLQSTVKETLIQSIYFNLKEAEISAAEVCIIAITSVKDNHGAVFCRPRR